ncbi:hypothetical protein [Candidatus Binatus sp.]|uniref:hypothetical protein n=1 Tax=Candidatus Binatus sp. TaxID=2811406 RepID=UPI003CB91289
MEVFRVVWHQLAPILVARAVGFGLFRSSVRTIDLPTSSAGTLPSVTVGSGGESPARFQGGLMATAREQVIFRAVTDQHAGQNGCDRAAPSNANIYSRRGQYRERSCDHP